MRDTNVIKPVDLMDIFDHYTGEYWFTFNSVGVAQFDGAVTMEEVLCDTKKSIISFEIQGLLCEIDLKRASVINVKRIDYLEDEAMELLVHLDCIDTIVRFIFIMNQFTDKNYIEQEYLKNI